MERKTTTVIALIVAGTLIFGTGSMASAASSSLDKNRQSSENINNQIKQEKEALEKGKQDEAALSKQIEELEVKIGDAENEMETLRGKIQTTEGQVAAAKKELAQAEKEVNTQNENLNVRLRTMYKNGSIGFLDVLLGSGSLSEFISNLDMVQKIHSNDKVVLSNLKERYKTVNEKKKKLESAQAQLESQKAEQAAKQAALTADKKTVSEKKATVTASNAQHQDNIEDLNAEAERIASIIQQDIEREQREAEEAKQKKKETEGKSNSSSSSGNSESASSGSGKFSWPVPGYTRVSSKYGWRNCPFHGREKHTGLDIPAPYGTAVKAAADGTVIFSGYLGSYGNAVIIRHSGSVYTLYGHNSSLVVRSGARVSRGKTIAKVGSTGSSTGNHCHFEVRKGGSGYGNDVNPWNYL